MANDPDPSPAPAPDRPDGPDGALRASRRTMLCGMLAGGCAALAGAPDRPAWSRRRHVALRFEVPAHHTPPHHTLPSDASA